MSHPAITAWPLCPARVHEVCGAAAASFALCLAQHSTTDLLWLREDRQPEQLNPHGFGGFDPARLVQVRTRNQTDTLAIAEEALRDGIFGLVVLQTTAGLNLTAGRRLQLAAQAGGATGLCIIPQGLGSPAAQTRWQCDPQFCAADSTRQHWQLIKNKSGTTGVWDVQWNPQTRGLVVVPPAGKRPGFAGMPG